MPPANVKDFLDRHRISYELLTHPRAYTAQGVAASLHVSGRGFAKSVIVRTRDGRLLLAVVPGPRQVDLKALQSLVGTPVELAHEQDFANRFPGCELGAEPPFGNLYDLPVYVDESLRDDEEVIFNAGSHGEAIRMKYADFEALIKPVVGPLSRGH